MCPMALISAIMVTTLFEIEHPCDTSKNGLYHRGMIYSLIDLSQCVVSGEGCSYQSWSSWRGGEIGANYDLRPGPGHLRSGDKYLYCQTCQSHQMIVSP